MTHCALCKQSKTLCRSHIIPEFMYSSLYDEKHKFYVLSANLAKPSWTEQKGLRERLLCQACETKLSRWEDYACDLLSNRVPTVAKRSGDLIWVHGADYTRFKLFQLSILWRAAVSSLQIFSNVVLGPHEERIRVRLLAEDPGQAWEYGCALYALTTPTGVDRSLIVQPTLTYIDGIHTYHFVFGGLVWLYFVSSHPPERAASTGFVQRNGRFAFLAMPTMGADYIEHLAESFHRAREAEGDAL